MIVLLFYFIFSSIEYFIKEKDLETIDNIKYIKERTISGC